MSLQRPRIQQTQAHTSRPGDTDPLPPEESCADSIPCPEPSPRQEPGHSAEGEPCPSPLSWQQVLQAFRTESEPWTLDRGRYTLHGRTWGQGPPLYLLNGLGGSCELYALLVWLLRDDFRCVLYDYPGTRAETLPPGRLSSRELAADLLAAADHLGDSRLSVYATSFGTLIALSAMLQSPERIERAVFQGGFAHRKLTLFERLLVRMARRMARPLDRMPLRRWVQRQTHRPWFPPFDASRWEFFVQNTGRVPVAALAQRADVVEREDLRPRLSDIQQPVLLIRSEGEGLVSATSHEELEEGLPETRTEWLALCGHLPYLTHPHRLAKRIRPFLTDEARGSHPAGSE